MPKNNSLPQSHGLTTDDLLQMMEVCRPPRHPGKSSSSDSSTAGMGHVVRILSKFRKPVTSGELSRESGVSTARIAVLLRKLEEKGLITRSGDPKDARKTMVALTDAGKAHAAQKDAEFRAMLQEVIDTIGEDRLQEYIETTREIRAIAEKGFRRATREDSDLFGSPEGGIHT